MLHFVSHFPSEFRTGYSTYLSSITSLVHLSSCSHVSRFQLSLPRAYPLCPRSTLLFAKVLKNGCSCRLPTTTDTANSPQRRRSQVYSNPIFHGNGDVRSAKASSIYQWTGPLSRISHMPDFRYFLRIVSRSDGWRYLMLSLIRSWCRSLYVLWTSVIPKVAPIGMHIICRDYTDTLWAIRASK